MSVPWWVSRTWIGFGISSPIVLLTSTTRLWNYNPDNDDRAGDDWSGENFSWFSQKRALPSSWLDHTQTSPTLDNGGRILRAVVRPYPAKTAGIPLRFTYEINTSEFEFELILLLGLLESLEGKKG